MGREHVHFLTSYQVVLMLLVRESHLENQGVGPPKMDEGLLGAHMCPEQRENKGSVCSSSSQVKAQD